MAAVLDAALQDRLRDSEFWRAEFWQDLNAGVCSLLYLDCLGLLFECCQAASLCDLDLHAALSLALFLWDDQDEGPCCPIQSGYRESTIAEVSRRDSLKE